MVETTASLKAVIGDEEVPVTHTTLQVATRIRSKRRIVNIDPSQSEGVKKKHEELQQGVYQPCPAIAGRNEIAV